MSIVLVFVDGLGLGRRNNPSNPLARGSLAILGNFLPESWEPPAQGGRPLTLPMVERDNELPWGGKAVAVDASLGIPGLPQSATGQTTLLTGVNGGEALGGRHYTGFPTITLKKVIQQHSVFKQLKDTNRKAVFLNAFGPGFFAQGEAVWEQPFLGATTWANKAAGLPFKTFQELAEGKAIFHDITHDSMPGHQRIAPEDRLPLRSVDDAAKTLVGAAAENDFVLFEFFQTDKAGHAQDANKAVHELEKLEGFLNAVLAGVNLGQTTVLVTSDHGNVEDLSTDRHTLNPVPGLIFGRQAGALAARLNRLEAFTPAIVDSA